jgi:excisionase family DNA binding protein
MAAGDLDNLLQPDGSVVVPAAIAEDVLRMIVLALDTRSRADGGSLGPMARRVLWALHRAAQRHDAQQAQLTGDVASDVPRLATVEVTVAEAAELLGCTPQWVRYLLSTGRITGRKVSPRLWLVDRASLDAYRYGGHSAQGQSA